MTFEQLLLAAVEQRLLRPLDVQFALMVAQNDPPAVMLAAALLEPGCWRGARLPAAVAVERRRGAERKSGGDPRSAAGRSRRAGGLARAAARFVGGELRRCSGADDFVRRPALSEPDVAQRADRRPLL
ncbi:hypothetical protein LNO36_24160 [Klebsiella variicola subsp. variicola]|nr:hypothetical protein [Klebsiella variicola subsp. variicola]